MQDETGTTSSSAGGVVGAHPAVQPLELHVAPSTADQRNTVHLRLVPLGCLRVEDVRFRFDSSFVLPSIQPEIERLAQMLASERLKDCPLSIFGHADPVGNDDYNKALSGRRATAIHALLVRNVDLWEKLFSNPVGGDRWGEEAIATMLARVALDEPPDDSPVKFGRQRIDADGDATGESDTPQAPASPPAQSEVAGVARSAGKRRELYLKYMDKLCGALKLDPKKDFLGRGADAGGKADFQGCSEFNPLLIFSDERQRVFSSAEHDQDARVLAERNRGNALNRRVMILIFRKGSKVDVARWPCPRASEGVAGCKKRFFSDGESRRSRRLSDEDRTFDATGDTFACRFYQRVSDSTPCEQVGGIDFRYALQKSEDLPWSDKAQLRIVSVDGAQERIFRMSEGELVGDLLVFTFPHCRPGVLYKGEIRDGGIFLQLFPPTDLFGIEDPQDADNVIPLNPQNAQANELPSSGGGIAPDPLDDTILRGDPL